VSEMQGRAVGGLERLVGWLVLWLWVGVLVNVRLMCGEGVD
jgi:hypothetical protein